MTTTAPSADAPQAGLGGEGAQYELLLGDAVQVMRGLPANSVQMVCTSPPYLGLRAYLPDDHPDKHLEIGTEQTPDEFVAKLVEVFREVRRVLHPSGTCWIVIGDSYNGSGGAGGDYSVGGLKEGQPKYPGRNVNGLGPKQLLGIPWRVAFALQADGWILRSEIIWHKRAPMPESVTDRPTKAHEQVFLLAKNATYFYDHVAIMEPNAEPAGNGGWQNAVAQGNPDKYMGRYLPNKTQGAAGGANVSKRGNCGGNTNGRNKRSVWTLGPESFDGAHFAVMPTKLVEPCILAGTSAHGACSKCLAPWARLVERVAERETHGINRVADDARAHEPLRANGTRHGNTSVMSTGVVAVKETTGWAATCQCQADVVPCTVLDCFNGAATTGIVAIKHGRNYIGIDLNPEYLELSRKRLAQVQPLLFALEVQ